MARHLNARWRRLLAAGCLVLAGTLPALALDAPATTREPVVDTFHGTTVEDPYRWLENTNTPDARAWFAAQSAYTRSVLDALPGRLGQALLPLGGVNETRKARMAPSIPP